MKVTLNILEKPSEDQRRRWPGYILGGRLRTSTLVLIVALLAVYWVYDRNKPPPPLPTKPPATQFVPIPPGMQPDPNYTWVPRDRVNQSATDTTTPTTTTTTPPAPTSTSPVTTTTPPPFVLPTPPCLLPAPFCPPSSPATSPSQLPQPGGGVSPTPSSSSR